MRTPPLLTLALAACLARAGGFRLPLRASAAPPPGAAEPLFSAPLPGGTSGRVVVPAPEVLRGLLNDVLGEVRSAGFAAGATRTLQAQRALLQTTLALSRDAAFRDALQRRQAPDTRSVARALRLLFEKLGATYVKLGQFIASSPTLFPEDFVLEFQKCLDQTTSVDFATVKRIIEADLGQPLSALYADVDPVPLASASIAQVHAATLKSGERVVIKVRKPGVEEVLKTDLAFLSIGTKILETFAPELKRISLADITADIKDSMLGELDFNQEADNLVVYERFLRESELDATATCPLPVRELTAKKVLTMTRLDGVPLLDAEALRRTAATAGAAEAAVATALNVWSTSVVSCDFFHADVHGGNLLLCDDGRVGFIDFGIVGRLPPKVWNAVTGLGESFVTGDFEAMAKSLVAMGAAEETVDTAKFGRDLEAIFDRMSRVQPTVTVGTTTTASGDVAAFSTLDVDDEEVSRIVIDIINAAEDNGLKLPREFGLLTKQALYFDRYLKSLAPDLDPLNDPRVQLSAPGRSAAPALGDA
mmetsp:Transcript_23335/g.73141  ORF Transcript_23335/g.73141 Transcript_23335/m.73141 type:complete len:535 (-) Transcript_23335:303-1907(-)